MCLHLIAFMPCLTMFSNAKNKTDVGKTNVESKKLYIQLKPKGIDNGKPKVEWNHLINRQWQFGTKHKYTVTLSVSTAYKCDQCIDKVGNQNGERV